jgi:putative ABC transport system permease protein
MPLFRRIANLLRRSEVDREIDAELRSHLEMRVEDNIAAGMTREAAERDARLRFGNPVVARERVAGADAALGLDRVWSDLRYALRQMRKSPKFAAVAVMTLALGIGATATVYSVVHAVLIDPYPYRGANRMVHFHLYDKEPFPYDMALTGPQFVQFGKSPVLDGAIADDGFSRALTGEELPEQVQAASLSPNAFQYFGVPALLGRAFTPADSLKTAVLSWHFWKAHYSGHADVIGKTIQLDRENYTILGVMPQRFAWTGSDVYVPLAYSSDPHRIAGVYGRLKARVSDAAAERALQPMLDVFAKETPESFPQKFKVHLVRINEIAVGRFSGVLVILFISVCFLLVLACVNVAILLLARGEARQPEIALRKALGAGRGRIVGQLLTEALLLSASGGFLGVPLAAGGIRLVRLWLPQSVFPAEAEILLNMPVLLFSVGVSMLTGIVSGLWPALRVSRAQLRRAMDAGSAKLAGQLGTRRSHTVLLTVQVALTVLLLACSGATLRRLSQLVHADLGYDPHHLISVSMALRDGAHTHWADRIGYYEQIRKAVSSNQEIVSAAIAQNNLPPSIVDAVSLSVPGSSSAFTGHIVKQQVSPEYFSTLRIPLLRGRVWTGAEVAHAAHFALINRAMQKRWWPNASPVGQTVVLNNGAVIGNVWTLVAPGNDNRFQIIGVVGDSPNKGLDEEVSPAIYLPYTMNPYDWLNLMIRTRGDAPGLLRRIKEQVYAIDADQAVGDVTYATDLLESDSLGRERFVSYLFTAFAVLGLAFAASGLNSVLSYLVAQRTRELGLRIALGAQRWQIAGLVTRPSLLAVACGAAIGLAADFACSRIFAQWTHGDARDPLVLVLVLAILLTVACAASTIPAWIAASIAPSRALRME